MQNTFIEAKDRHSEHFNYDVLHQLNLSWL